MKTINIKPLVIELSKLIISVDYHLNERAIIFYQFLDSDGEVIKTGNYQLTPSELDNWGTDDTYLEDLILSKLNLKRS